MSRSESSRGHEAERRNRGENERRGVLRRAVFFAVYKERRTVFRESTCFDADEIADEE